MGVCQVSSGILKVLKTDIENSLIVMLVQRASKGRKRSTASSKILSFIGSSMTGQVPQLQDSFPPVRHPNMILW